MTPTAANSTVLAWTDTSAGVNPVTRDCAGTMPSSSTGLAVQSQLSAGLRVMRQPRTYGESVYPTPR